jgi:TRAP transporter TAXI family solute receptor
MHRLTRTQRTPITILLAALAVAAIVQGGGAETRFATIGTGGVTGVYYPAGGAIAKLVNKTRDQHGIRVAVESTAGSVFNINAVLSGDLDFGIAQSDRQYQAINGLADWEEKGPQSGLRAIASLHPEAVTLVAAVDAGIEALADLRGKRINIGNPGSGQRGNSIDVLTTAGIDWREDVRAEGLKASECAKMLQDGRIDAFFYTVGHPAGAITEATAGRREIRIVPITEMEPLLERVPYYAETMIPAALYPTAANTDDVPTIGVMTTLVTSVREPADVVYTLTKALFENLDEFREQHPAFAGLTPEGMLRGLTAPLHEGARRYYLEAGLIEEDGTE